MKLIRQIDPTENFHFGLLHFEHDGIPTFEECRQLIREVAYSKWHQAGSPPGDGIDFWLHAEKVLFGRLERGYRIFVRDMTKPLINDYYHHYDVARVTPDGYRFVGYEDE